MYGTDDSITYKVMWHHCLCNSPICLHAKSFQPQVYKMWTFVYNDHDDDDMIGIGQLCWKLK